ncbi:MAG: excinuclease ABC subunit UvrC [Euryarchaeota archaeon]|nr:excinuclease ABC subunit UvrC [Euryarchaeota archaeon]
MAPSGPEPPTPELPRGPNQPGVYLFKAKDGSVLYIGKARNLRKRVTDHLRLQTDKDGYITSQSENVEFLPTRNEREALLLEAHLIRLYQPRYNVIFRDDKSYPYLALTEGEEVPRVYFVRRPKRERGTALFGPYRSAREARSLVRLLAESFQVRRCRTLPKRACLYYHLKTCSAPCIGAISLEEYRHQVERARLLLKGRGKELLPDLEQDMVAAAKAQEYERAAVVRDAIRGIRDLEARQHVVDLGRDRTDAVAIALPTDVSSLSAAVGVLRVREGSIAGGDPHLLEIPADLESPSTELLSTFLLQYYGDVPDPPAEVLLPENVEGLEEALAVLGEERAISFVRAKAGRPKELVQMAEKMARAHLDAHAKPSAPEPVLRSLMSLLELPRLPRHIEGVDISLIQGTNAVGSLVVFRNGAPSKDDYRRFRIRTVEGTNDFAMVHEVVLRRFRRLLAEEEKLPDLLLIDGGRGQLDAALGALRELNLTSEEVPIASLAKQHEEVYLPDLSRPLRADPNAPPMLLLRHVRDESHRFAITYHRRRRRMALREEIDRLPAS